MSQKPSEKIAVVGTIDPDAYTASTYVSDYIDMSKWHSLMAVIAVGAMTASGTVDAKLRQATTATGASVKDITGKSITQLTATGDSDKQAIINLRDQELDIDGGFRYVNLTVTVAVAASDAGAIVLGCDPRNAPANANDLASVDEIV